MRRRPSAFLTASLVLVVLAAAAGARAELAPQSPFLPPNSPGGSAAEGPSGPIELRGEMSTSEGTRYCIFDTVKKSATWVGVNEESHGLTVKSADSKDDSVTVEFQGRTLKLVLRTAKVASSGSGGMIQGTLMTPAQPGVVLNPTPADEQRRLDAVAAEVRRRRMERDKAIQDAEAAGRAPGGGPPPIPSH